MSVMLTSCIMHFAICVFVLARIISAQGTTYRTSSTVSNILPNKRVCGLYEAEDKRLFRYIVLSGEITHIKEFPWTAALEYRDKFSGRNAGVKCGGSIINNRYVLTAAHCIMDHNFDLIKVRLGEWRISTDPDCPDEPRNYCSDPVKKFFIEAQIVHPEYRPLSKTNDIGLLRLETEFQYTDYIRPICLPDADHPYPQIGTLMTVVGWGATENNTSSDVKLKVDVPLMTSDDCQTTLRGKPISTTQLCVGGETGRDTCRGDSGGPLMRRFEDSPSIKNQWYLEGMVSWGVGCGLTGIPAIYTRVLPYRDWIIDTISSKPPILSSTRVGSPLQDYYWRNYNGEIPSDAVRGGTDKLGNPIYIGRGRFTPTGLFPGTLHPNSLLLKVTVNGDVHSREDNVKILCSQHTYKFLWVQVNYENIHSLENSHLVLGGWLDDSPLYIGRILHEGSTEIGKVYNINPYEGLTLPNQDNTETNYKKFEILIYILN